MKRQQTLFNFKALNALNYNRNPKSNSCSLSNQNHFKQYTKPVYSVSCNCIENNLLVHLN